MSGYFGKRARRKAGVAGSTPVQAGNGLVAEHSSRSQLSPPIPFEGSESAVTSKKHLNRVLVQIQNLRSFSSLVSIYGK